MESNQYDLIIPMNDYAAIYLADHKEHLKQFAHIVVNDLPIFKLAINKLNTMKLCEENGIPSPKTFFVENAEELLLRNDLMFPLVVKPQTACGSIGFNIVENKKHLIKVLNTDAGNGPVFAQEYIPQDGPQYGAEAFRNKDGSYSFVLIDKKPRWFPLDGGSPTINVTMHDDTMADMARKLLEAMDWVGYANIDYVVDSRTNEPKIIEVNGRISAAVTIDEAAGINVAELICQNEFGDSATIYPDYKDDIRVSCILTEILWFIKSPDRKKNKPSMFYRKNTKDVIFRLNDPKPFFAFCVQSLKNYRHAMEQRKRN